MIQSSKLKIVYISIDTLKKVKRYPQNARIAKYTSDKRLVSSMYNLLQQNTKAIYPVKNE